MKHTRTRHVTCIPAVVCTKKRVAIYCRVSTTRCTQAESMEMQKQGLEKTVKDNPYWKVYQIYEDYDSGKNTFRPGFISMMIDSRERLFDIILVKSISRFSRNAVDLLDVVRQLREYGIEVIFELENVRTSISEQDFIIAVHVALAQAEGESMSEAIKWGHKRGFKRGNSKMYLRKCYGYTKNTHGELISDEVQAAVVRSIFEWYLKGNSIDRIMKTLVSRGIPSPTGKEK